MDQCARAFTALGNHPLATTSPTPQGIMNPNQEQNEKPAPVAGEAEMPHSYSSESAPRKLWDEEDMRDYVVKVTALASRQQEVERLREAIKRALADSESGTGWGPDITVCSYLRAALGSNDAPATTTETAGKIAGDSPPAPAKEAQTCVNCGGTGTMGRGHGFVACPICTSEPKLEASTSAGETGKTSFDDRPTWGSVLAELARLRAVEVAAERVATAIESPWFESDIVQDEIKAALAAYRAAVDKPKEGA